MNDTLFKTGAEIVKRCAINPKAMICPYVDEEWALVSGLQKKIKEIDWSKVFDGIAWKYIEDREEEPDLPRNVKLPMIRPRGISLCCIEFVNQQISERMIASLLEEKKMDKKEKEVSE